MLYNAPRAASIKCQEDGKLFTLDRATFSHIMSGSANKKRSKTIQTMKKIELFKSLSPFEQEQLCDALKE